MISSKAKFCLYLITLIPSFICTLFVLYYLLFVRTLRRSLHNHVIIVLLFTVLFCELTMYPWMLYYLAKSNIWQRSYVFCVIWNFIDWAVYMLQLHLFAWATIERHILIFHDRWVSTQRKRLCFHYLPVIVIFIYWLIFYAYIYFYPICQNEHDDSNMICVNTCSFNILSYRVFDTLFNNIFPSSTIVLSSVTLLIRILRQKYRMHQQIQWKKHRKMTIQILSISTLYLLLTTPWAMTTLFKICGLESIVTEAYESYSGLFSYFIVLLFPFVSLLSLPELRVKFERILCKHRAQRTIRPEGIAGKIT